METKNEEQTEVSDFFLDDKNCIDRLFEEWKKYGQLIVAYDYDSTVFDYYKKGWKFKKVIELIRDCKRMGFHLTLFTSCNDDRMPEIKKYLADNDIPYHSINETPDYIPFRGRKVYFNILLDDRAGLSSTYDQLLTVIAKIRSHKQTELIPESGY
jgi:hypothetical protein